MKKALIAIIGFFSISVLSGCTVGVDDSSVNLNLTELPVPSIVGYDDSTHLVSWNSVSNCDGYTVKINTSEYNVESLSYTVSFSENQSFSFAIKARGKSLYTSDSPWSETKTYSYTVSSNPNPVKLATPSITSYENNTVYWGNVDHATKYTVKVNSTEFTATNNNYPVSFTSSCSFSFAVRASSDDSSYENSDWSDTKTYDYVLNEGGGTFLQSGIGYSVDVVSATSYSDYKKGVSVLDRTKLSNASFDKSDKNYSSIKSNSTQSISDFVSNNSVTYEINVKSNSKMRTMFCNIDVGLKGSSTFNYSSYSDKYFYSLDSYIEKYNLSLVDYDVNNKYLSYLSDDYKSSVSALYQDQTADNFNAFFKKYGTHLIASGTFGGRLNAYFSTVTNKSTIDSSTSAEMKVAVEEGISAVNNSSVSTNITAKVQNILNTSSFETSFYAVAYGGNSFTATGMDSLNTHYSTWADSFNGSSSTSVLINYSSDGLIPVWKLLPESCSSMATAMEDAFSTYCQDSYTGFIDSFTCETAEHYISTKPLSCSLDNGYNYDSPDTNANNIHFSHEFDFGSFVVSNSIATDKSDSFVIVGSSPIDISFRMKYDADNLPLQDNMTSRSVSSDGKYSNFYKMPWAIGERTVGKGMFVVLVEYTDCSPSKQICLTDALNGAKGGDYISVVEGVSKKCTITIALCYELTMWAPGFLGISDDYWMNWRINQTISIV